MSSVVLTKELREAVGAKLGSKASILASCLATLHFKEGSKFTASSTSGPCVLIVDRAKEGTPKVIQIYDSVRMDATFECELYEGMKYEPQLPLYHMFVAQNGAEYALAFSNQDEANAFSGRVLGMIPRGADMHTTPKKEKGGLLRRLSSLLSRKKAEPTTSVQIGSPSNFVHKSHVGFDATKGFDVSNLPSEWKQLFKSAGIKKKELKNIETATEIYKAAQSVLGESCASPPRPQRPLSYSGRRKSAGPPPAIPPRPLGLARFAPPPIGAAQSMAKDNSNKHEGGASTQFQVDVSTADSGVKQTDTVAQWEHEQKMKTAEAKREHKECPVVLIEELQTYAEPAQPALPPILTEADEPSLLDPPPLPPSLPPSPCAARKSKQKSLDNASRIGTAQPATKHIPKAPPLAVDALPVTRLMRAQTMMLPVSMDSTARQRAATSAPNDRAGLLAQIRLGKSLKKVASTSSKGLDLMKLDKAGMSSMIATLQSIMATRRSAITQSSQQDSDEDEWSD